MYFFLAVNTRQCVTVTSFMWLWYLWWMYVNIYVLCLSRVYRKYVLVCSGLGQLASLVLVCRVTHWGVRERNSRPTSNCLASVGMPLPLMFAAQHLYLRPPALHCTAAHRPSFCPSHYKNQIFILNVHETHIHTYRDIHWGQQQNVDDTLSARRPTLNRNRIGCFFFFFRVNTGGCCFPMLPLFLFCCCMFFFSFYIFFRFCHFLTQHNKTLRSVILTLQL